MNKNIYRFKRESSKVSRKYVAILATLLPFLLFMATGIVLFLYHTEKSTDERYTECK